MKEIDKIFSGLSEKLAEFDHIYAKATFSGDELLADRTADEMYEFAFSRYSLIRKHVKRLDEFIQLETDAVKRRDLESRRAYANAHASELVKYLKSSADNALELRWDLLET